MKHFAPVCAFMVLIPILRAQTINGNIEGRLLDAKGEPVPGASVVVTSPDLLGTRATTSNLDGGFRLIALPPGTYTVRISHLAYASPIVEGVRVPLGGTVGIGEIRLEEKIVTLGEVVVTAEHTVIDPVSTTNGRNLRAEELKVLPLQRDYRQIAELVPQSTINYRRDGLSFHGSTGLENKFFIQGTDVTDATGISNLNTGHIPYNFVKEIQIKTGSYEAEYESSLGGIVNVLTYSGGNELHAQAFTFFSNNSLSGNPLTVGEPLKKASWQYDLGIGVGGPIVRDRLWYYAAYNPQFGGERIPVVGQGDKDFNETAHIAALKLSLLVDENNRIEWATFGDPHSSWRPGGAPLTYTALNMESVKTPMKLGNVHSLVTGSHLVSDRVLLESAVRYSRFYEIIGSKEDQQRLGWSCLDHVSQTVSGGPSYVTDEHADVVRLSLKCTWMPEGHSIKGGVEFKRLDRHIGSEQAQLWKYGDSAYSAVVSSARGTNSVAIPSAFLQDSWNISLAWRLNAGIRWDPTFLYGTDGQLAQKVLSQVAPRLGVIFLPDGSDNEKISLSLGRFYQNLAPWLSTFYHTNDLVISVLSYDRDPRTNAVTGDTVYSMVGQIYPEVTDLKGQYVDEVSAAYERTLTESLTAGVRVIYRTLGMGIEDVIDPSTGRAMFGNPGYGALSDWPQIQREYTAVELTLVRKVPEGLTYEVSYVLSRLYGNHPGLVDLEANIGGQNATYMYDTPQMLVNATGLLHHDRTHTLKGFASYRFDFGLVAGTSFFLASGTPRSERGGTNFGPPYHGYLKQRGTAGRTPTIWDLNVRLTYDVASWFGAARSARLILDVFHLASDKTPVEYDDIKYFGVDANGNQTSPNPNFGKAIRFQPPMSARFGLEVDF